MAFCISGWLCFFIEDDKAIVGIASLGYGFY